LVLEGVDAEVVALLGMTVGTFAAPAAELSGTGAEVFGAAETGPGVENLGAAAGVGGFDERAWLENPDGVPNTGFDGAPQPTVAAFDVDGLVS
jgi:hypothetical protein